MKKENKSVENTSPMSWILTSPDDFPSKSPIKPPNFSVLVAPFPSPIKKQLMPLFPS